MAIETIIVLLFSGLARGLVFALLGAGITLVFGLGDVLNLALGVFAIIAVIAAVETTTIASSAFAGAFVGLLVVSVLALAVDRVLLSSVYREQDEQRILLGIFLTLGLAIFLEGILFVYYPLSYSLPHGVPGVSLGEVTIRGSTIAILTIASVVLGLLFVFLRRTYLGKATRTVFQNERGAQLCGINPRRVRTLMFVLSAVIVGIAGILLSFNSNVTAASAFELTVFGIIVSIVGGVRNIRGTIAAGLLLGFVITASNSFIGAYVSNVLLFGVAVAVLLVKPEEIA